MKLTVGDIRFSECGYASTIIDVWGEKSLLPLYSMDVSTPLVEGKALEQYKDELLTKARERIAEIYKEIVCAGNDVGEQSAILTQAAHSISIQITRLREEKRPEDTEAPETNKKIINYHYPEGVVRVALSALL